MVMTIETAVEEHKGLLRKLSLLEQDIKSALERENILKGRIEQLETELTRTQEWSEYHLRCATEIAMQLHNVGIFVSDALHTAKNSVGKNNGQGQIESAYEKVEEALSVTKEVGHEPVQHERER